MQRLIKILPILTLLFILGNAKYVFSQDNFSNKGLIADANIYRNTISSKHKNPFTKSELNTSDRFFVLIGRKVMSSSLMNAVELKKSTNATFVGEQTGGNINHFGELKSFILPDSKMKVTYSTKYWENWKNHDGSFKPDIETTNSLIDFLRSYDKALELIMHK